VGELTVDLRGYQLEGLSVSVVIGQATIRLPEKGRFDASIKGVIGETVIVVPDGMEVRLNTNALLGGVEVPSDYKRVGDAYQSPGYNSASQRIDIDVDQVIGKITVEAQ
jgi:predicted membrane protein